jgi:cytochrome c oxidase cbb3-type subunit 4
MDFATLHSMWTVLIFVVFAVIAIWAFLPSRKTRMDEAGRSIFDSDDAPDSCEKSVEGKP